MNMSEVIHNPNAILQRINEMEKELEELKIMVLKMKAESLPVEEVDEETLRGLEKRFEEYKIHSF
jgi:predicted RNase H-like nuclease (RuvC/YqgF family)